MATFASRLREALDMNHMTAAELHRRTGISEGQISQYLKGDYLAKQDKVYAISQVLGVSPNWLMAFDDPSPEMLAEEVKIVFNSLSTERQNQALEYLHFLLTQQDKEASSEESPELL